MTFELNAAIPMSGQASLGSGIDALQKTSAIMQQQQQIADNAMKIKQNQDVIQRKADAQKFLADEINLPKTEAGELDHIRITQHLSGLDPDIANQYATTMGNAIDNQYKGTVYKGNNAQMIQKLADAQLEYSGNKAKAFLDEYEKNPNDPILQYQWKYLKNDLQNYMGYNGSSPETSIPEFKTQDGQTNPDALGFVQNLATAFTNKALASKEAKLSESDKAAQAWQQVKAGTLSKEDFFVQFPQSLDAQRTVTGEKTKDEIAKEERKTVADIQMKELESNIKTTEEKHKENVTALPLLETNIKKSSELLTTINEVIGDSGNKPIPGFNGTFGAKVDVLGGLLKKPLQGTPAANAYAKLQQIKGSLSLAIARENRGQGALSDAERAMMAEAATALSYDMTPTDALKELNKIKGLIEKSKTTSEGKLEGINKWEETKGKPVIGNMSRDKFIVGKKYQGKDGTTKTYKGNGVFE